MHVIARNIGVGMMILRLSDPTIETNIYQMDLPAIQEQIYQRYR